MTPLPPKVAPAARVRTKESVKEKLLDALEDIIDDVETKTASRIRAIEVFGREFGVFIEQKRVQVDVNTVVRHLTEGQLKAITNGNGFSNEKGEPYIDVDPISPVDSVPSVNASVLPREDFHDNGAG